MLGIYSVRLVVNSQCHLMLTSKFEPCHEKTCHAICEQQGADQPAHPRSLINTLIVRSLDSMIPVADMHRISRF